jgi:hypothetical protein
MLKAMLEATPAAITCAVSQMFKQAYRFVGEM